MSWLNENGFAWQKPELVTLVFSTTYPDSTKCPNDPKWWWLDPFDQFFWLKLVGQNPPCHCLNAWSDHSSDSFIYIPSSSARVRVIHFSSYHSIHLIDFSGRHIRGSHGICLLPHMKTHVHILYSVFCIINQAFNQFWHPHQIRSTRWCSCAVACVIRRFCGSVWPGQLPLEVI